MKGIFFAASDCNVKTENQAQTCILSHRVQHNIKVPIETACNYRGTVPYKPRVDPGCKMIVIISTKLWFPFTYKHNFTRRPLLSCDQG